MQWRRKKTLVDYKKQSLFSIELMAIVFGFIFLTAYMLFMPPMSSWMGGDELPEEILPKLTLLIKMKWPIVFVASVVLFMLGLLMSHRLWGPIVGIKKTIERMKKGDPEAHLNLRGTDYLLPLQDDLNELISENIALKKGIAQLVESLRQNEPHSPHIAFLQALIKTNPYEPTE